MERLSFYELPDTVKLILTESKQSKKISNSDFLFYTNANQDYKLVAKETEPFTDHFEIVENRRKITLIVPYEKAFPFIIYVNVNSLYIPDRYNAKDNETAKLAKYERYFLEFE